MLGVIGDVVQDVVVWQLEEVRDATDTHSEVRMTRGGSAANVAAFAGPRHPTRFIGCVGDDLGGVALTEDLARCGIDVRMQVRGHTGMIVVLVDQAGERRMFPSRGASALLQAIDPAWLDGVDLLHVTAYSFVGGSTPDAVLDAVHAVRRAGGAVSVDVSSIGLIAQYGVTAFGRLLAELRPDYVSANADESRLLGLAEDGRAGPGLAGLGDAVLLARRGRGDTHVFRAGRLVATVPVAPVERVRDLTGAGDAFNAGFLTARLAGEGLQESVLAAHALAARVLGCPGATESSARTP